MTGASAELALAATLTVCGAAGVPFAAELLRRLPRRQPVFFARWGFSHVLLALLAGLSASLLLGPLFLRGAAGEEPGVLRVLWVTMAILAAAAAVALASARRLHPEGVAALGLARGGLARAFLAAAAGYLLVLPAYLGVAFWWPPLAERLGFHVEPQEVLVAIEGLEGSALVQAVVLAVLVGPLLEELVFRGFLQPLLVQNLRERGGIAVTSAAFAALHGASAFAPLFVLSVLLGYVQLRTHRLAAAWLVHGLHNALTLGMVLLGPEWVESFKDLQSSP